MALTSTTVFFTPPTCGPYRSSKTRIRWFTRSTNPSSPASTRTKPCPSSVRKRENHSFFTSVVPCHTKPLAASPQFYTPDTPEDLYADVMWELDWSVGTVMERLRELDILQNTIVIFMSDNGPWYGGSTGGLRGMKATTWEGGIRVPFIIYYPKVLGEHRTVSTPVSYPDIFPTLLSLSGITAPTHPVLDGRGYHTRIISAVPSRDPFSVCTTARSCRSAKGTGNCL